MSIFKGGWHPDKGKDGGSGGKGFGKSISARGDFKGVNQIAGLMGKSRSSEKEWEKGVEHHSAPLSTLRDPAEFGPPPKHVGAHGPQAAAAQPAASMPAKSPTSAPRSSNSGIGGPVPRPYQGQSASSQCETSSQTSATEYGVEPSPTPPPSSRQTPRLPPRLPPRQNSHPDSHAPDPPPTYTESTKAADSSGSGYLNKASIGRLGSAGVNVSGFGIGGSGGSSAPKSPASSSQHAGQMNELQSRFSKLGQNSSSNSNTNSAPAPATGTTWAQKQGALQTAANFRKDPSTASLSDARDAASTANNFRQRHGDQVAAGWKSANNLNQKYGISDRVNAGSTGGASSGSTLNGNSNPESGSTNAAAQKKGPPPPPPKKRLALQSDSTSQNDTAQTPPPIPLSSKPR